MTRTERQAHDAKWMHINAHLTGYGYSVNWMFDYRNEQARARYRLLRRRPYELLLETDDEQHLLNMLHLLVGQHDIEKERSDL